MNTKKEQFKDRIEQLLNELKLKGISRRQIEIELAVEKEYIAQNLSRGGNATFYKRLLKFSKNVNTNIANGNNNVDEKLNSLPLIDASKPYVGKYTDEIMRDLAKGTVVVGESNKILSSNNQRLIAMMEYKFMPNSDVIKENQQESSLAQPPLLMRLADGGIGTFWKSRGEGLELLGNMLKVEELAKK